MSDSGESPTSDEDVEHPTKSTDTGPDGVEELGGDESLTVENLKGLFRCKTGLPLLKFTSSCSQGATRRTQ